jgi:hypothetical protein
VESTSRELLRTLDGVTDEASAQAAAPRVAQLTQQWKASAETATAAFLALRESEQSAAMIAAGQQVDARQADLNLQHGPDLLEQIQRIARSPAGPAIQRELMGLRDAYLTTRGPYSPTTVRRRIEEKLGPVGSPIQVD